VRVRRAALLGLLAALAGTGCGGGDSSNDQARQIPPPVVAKAEANCRYFLRRIKQIGNGALVREPGMSNLELTTAHLVGPSIPLLERVAARQQALQPAARDHWFDLYAELFDPIIALTKQRLAAGLADDYPRSRELEDLLTTRGLEQMDAARNAGLGACDVDFQNVLLSSLSE
jgi:hypothetical protein